MGIEKDAFEYVLRGSVPPQSGFRLTYLQQCLLGLALETGYLESLSRAREYIISSVELPEALHVCAMS